MGPCVSEKQRDTVAKYVEIGKAEGARLVTGGGKLTGRGPRRRAGSTRRPCSPTPTRRCASPSRRSSAPVTTVIPISSLEEAIQVANSVAYGLSGSIYTQDVNKAFTAMRDFETGIFYVNSSTIGAEVHLPFGGIKDTGNGHREAGIAGLDVFTRVEVDLRGLLGEAPEGADRHALSESGRGQAPPLRPGKGPGT